MAIADAPVAPNARYDSLDVLRGVAVLMIFSVNVRHMLQPFWTQGDPTVWAGPDDLAIDRALQFAVDGKWIAVFAVLFGAGLMLLHDKAVAAGADPKARIVRRQVLLVGFGLIHLLLIWLGDVLTTYGIVGLVAMTLLGRRSATVAAWAAFGLLLGMGTMWANGALMQLMTPEAMAENGFSFEAMIHAEREAKAGGIGAQVASRMEAAALVVPGVVVAGPFVLAYMLTGVLAYRSGFLLARWPVRRYLACAVPLLAAAWSIDAWRIERVGLWDGVEADAMMAVARYAWVGIPEGLLGGLGYAAVVNALVRAGLRFGPVAAAGRMAFTNYVLCSLVGTTLAAGHGAGLLGTLTLAQAMIVVGAVWAVILVVSPLWLASFRYGPLEWLWRSLGYGATQPMRQRPKGGPAPTPGRSLSRS